MWHLGGTRVTPSPAPDSASPDRLNFSEGQQPLVDAAFLALALLRAPRELWEELDARVRDNLVAALRETNRFKPGANNRVLFASTIKAVFRRFELEYDPRGWPRDYVVTRVGTSGTARTGMVPGCTGITTTV